MHPFAFFSVVVNLIPFVFCHPISNDSLRNNDPVSIVDDQNKNPSLGVQIVISFFLILACLDFVLQTCIFLYVFIGLVRTFKKVSDYAYATFGFILYVTVRVCFLPFLIRLIPWSWSSFVPILLVDIPVYINVGMFLLFYVLAAISCIYYLTFIGVRGKKLPGTLVDPKTGIEPMVVILMPIYNEEPDALFRAVESAIRCDYRPDRLHIFLAFDEASETPLYFALLRKLKVLSKKVSEEIKSKLKILEQAEATGISSHKTIEIFPPRLEWYIEGVRVTICRFPHEGKSPTQGKAFKVINDNYGADEATSANTLILFIDSDIILHENAIHNFVQPAVANPNIKGMTGLVTCRTSRKFNFYQYVQDAEYIDAQMFHRTAEAVLGTVTCLPGALTLIRLNALQKVAPKYFIELDKDRTVDFHRFHLGEDRYMTYLLTEESDGPYQVKFISGATCKTDAPDTFIKLLKQRRRWFLGGFVNDISTLISPMMWSKVPLVVLIKTHSYLSKGVEWTFPIMIISLVINKNPGIGLYVIVGLFALRYLLVCVNAFAMTRTKVGVSYVFFFFLSSVFNLIVMVYAVWTWSVRSWGGPRAESDGDELSQVNVLEEAMAQKEEGVGQTRRSLAQIKTISKIIHENLKADNLEGSVRSTAISSKRRKDIPPLKKYVPFPYQAEFLGGGGFDVIGVTLQPPSPTASLRSLQQSGQTLSPQSLSLHHNITIKQNYSASVSDIHKLSQQQVSQNIPYLFGQLEPNTQERTRSFQLNIENLAKFNLLVPQNSEMKDSSFNMRLSGRLSPTGTGSINGESRQDSVFSFLDSETSL